MENSWPEECEFLEFFESRPIESCPSDGFWCYEKKIKDDLVLMFSFNTHEKSIQTMITLKGELISSVCHEGAKSIFFEGKVDEKILRARFDDYGYRRELKIDFSTEPVVDWSLIIL